MAFVELRFEFLLRSFLRDDLGDDDLGGCRIDLGFEFFRRLREGGFVVDHEVGCADHHRLAGVADEVVVVEVGHQPAECLRIKLFFGF